MHLAQGNTKHRTAGVPTNIMTGQRDQKKGCPSKIGMGGNLAYITPPVCCVTDVVSMAALIMDLASDSAFFELPLTLPAEGFQTTLSY